MGHESIKDRNIEGKWEIRRHGYESIKDHNEAASIQLQAQLTRFCNLNLKTSSRPSITVTGTHSEHIFPFLEAGTCNRIWRGTCMKKG